MRVRYVSTLELMREVYSAPTVGPRFQAYLAAANREPVVLPLSTYNPMAKAAGQAAARLSLVDADVNTMPALSEDSAGGWTNRWQSVGPHTLGGFIRREGRSLHFADSTENPIAFAAWWGDEIAVSVGNPPLGLGPHARLNLAACDAVQEPGDLKSWLA